MPKKKKNARDGDLFSNVQDYRYETARRKNNPPAKIAAEGTVPAIPKAKYAYSPRRPPQLRFAPVDATSSSRILKTSGEDAASTVTLSATQTDQLPELLLEARQRPLSDDEIRLLADALRNHEPWLEWAAKREQHERGFFEVDPVALHIHERVSAQAILRVAARQDPQRDLFADPQLEYHQAVQFYRHDVDWSNRLILGDSLQVMSSLARREDLAGKVQMIYMDPPYGIKFASNFQPEVGRRDVKDKAQDLTREPEMVKAYRDTWHLGIHSYLSYLRDRLIVAKELLADSGSIFVQISDENLHKVRDLLDEIFGRENQVVTIVYKKKGNQKGGTLDPINDFILWYARSKQLVSIKPIFLTKFTADALPDDFDRIELPTGEIRIPVEDDFEHRQDLVKAGANLVYSDQLTSGGEFRTQLYEVSFEGRIFKPAKNNCWKHNEADMGRVINSERVMAGKDQIRFRKRASDFGCLSLTNLWADIAGAKDKRYVVQTNVRAIERCLLMTTEPGELVLDPTCGSGTTAYVAEQWGRRWITIDTSRVAIAIARQRLLTAKYEMFKTCRGTGVPPVLLEEHGQDAHATNPGLGFVYKTVPHVTLKSIAQNTNLDPIFAKHEPMLEERLAACNKALEKTPKNVRAKLLAKLEAKRSREGKKSIADADERRWLLPPDNRRGKNYTTVDPAFPGWYAWEVPFDTDPDWPEALQKAVTAYRAAWRAKMDEVNACIAANADQEELVDQPEVVRGVTRVSGPFTVEAVQPPEMSLSDVVAEIPGFDGEPEPLEGKFDVDATSPSRSSSGEDAASTDTSRPPMVLRRVEARADLEAQNLIAYLDKMMRLLRGDGVRFPNNRQMCFSRLEPLMGDSSGLHAEGRWTPQGEPDPDPEGAATICVAFGPQYGPVTAKLVEDLVRASSRRGYTDLVIAGFSFDGPAQAVIEEAQHPKLRLHMAHIRPDVNPGMDGLLKEQPGSQLFTVFGQPRASVDGPDAEGMYTVTMEGVDIYNPVTNEIVSSGASKVAAWFLDSDYDGRTFCITQAFFPDKAAWDKLAKALKGVLAPEAFDAFGGTTSLPFAPGPNQCIAVKVIDPRGNEVMKVQRIG